MVNNATNLELEKQLDSENVINSANNEIFNTSNNNEKSDTNLDCSLQKDDTSNNNFQLTEDLTSNNENTNVNCLALTVKKDYSLSVVKHVFVRTWRTTWRVALSVFILNFLTFFF